MLTSTFKMTALTYPQLLARNAELENIIAATSQRLAYGLGTETRELQMGFGGSNTISSREHAEMLQYSQTINQVIPVSATAGSEVSPYSDTVGSGVSPDSILISTIEKQFEKKGKRNIWENSPRKHIAELECDDVGRIGENVVQGICDELTITAAIDGTLTKAVGGGIGDGTIKGHSVEIKTARAGTGINTSFQHELGEKPWHAEYMLFIDIGPDHWWIHLFPNFSEEFYRNSAANNSIKCIEWGFPTKSITQRKGVGAFKFDTDKKLNEKAAEKIGGNTFCVTAPKTQEALADFIHRIILN
jgi:hypothetical protein